MTRIDTAFTRLLDLEVPIVQAPIGPCACPELAAAVSNAGGLGMLAVTWHQPQDIGSLIRQTRDQTDRPFGVNLILEWEQHERLAACLASGVGIVSFFWGDPAPYVDAVHGGGGRVVHTIGSAEEARRVVEAGVDVVVAQGVEAGGHVWGEIATMPLVPAVVDAVDVPVLSAGGVGDGRGLAAALALGASGAWIGTRFIASAESAAHDVYKQHVVRGKGGDAVLTTLFDAEWPNAKHRVLRTEAVRTSETSEQPTGYSAMLPTRDMTGDVEALAFYAGQSVELARVVQPAGAIVREIAADAARAIHASAASISE